MAGISSISASVGARAKNRAADVTTVVALINKVPAAEGGPTSPIVAFIGNHPGLIRAIRRFQNFHFGLSTGAIEPDNVTIAKLNLIVNGTHPPGLPQAFERTVVQAIVQQAREQVVSVARHEADRIDGVKGVQPAAKVDGKDVYQQTEQAAQRLKEYYSVFSHAANISSEAYRDGKPGGVSWCGIFATWVVKQAMARLGQTWDLTFVQGKQINVNGSAALFEQDGTDPIALVAKKEVDYTIGDVCLVKEENVSERFPTHHFIVAEDPAEALAGGRAMKTIEGNFPFKGGGARHSVTHNQRQVLNYAHWSVFRPASL